MKRGVIVVVLAIFLPGLSALGGRIFSSVDSIYLEDFPDCRNDLLKIADGLEKGQIWALKILDASTKIPSGILTGHLSDFGNFDECLNNGGNLSTRHCLTTINPGPGWGSGIIGEEDYNLPLRWSYCIPASCPALFLEEVLQSVVKEQKWNATVGVRESDCQSKAQKPLTIGDQLGISIWGIFIGLAVFSTIYDITVLKIGANRNPWLSAFSIYTNGKNLLKTDVSPETLAPLHGLRFLSICWVVMGHRYFFTLSSSLLNLADLAKELKKIRSQFFLQGVLAVDTFFLLSGLLNCYLLLKVLEKTERFPIKTYYIHRYVRLTPVLGAIVLMYATWYTLLGDGPIWDQTTSIWKQLCVDNWWPTLLYINNYYNPLSQCAGQSWYLAVDMQLYWLSPLLVLPLRRWPHKGKIFISFLICLSIISQFIVAYVYEFRMAFAFGFDVGQFELMKLLYVPTHMRATPYLIGIFLGYYLFTWRKSRPVFSKGIICLGWLLSTIVALAVVFGNFQFSRPLIDHPYDRWESSFYISLHRLGWGASIGWIIVACLNNSGGFINDILSWKCFIPLSRLTYCIFLCHMAIQQYQIGTARTSDYFQYFNQTHRYFGDLCFSILTATALSLIFESPILVLEKLTRGRVDGGRKPPNRNLKSEVNNGFQDDFSATDKTHEI